MKKSLLLVAALLGGHLALAQTYDKAITVSQSVSGGTISTKKSVATITATNAIDENASATYTAGQSVTLQPGFEAKAGSVFLATVEAVNLTNAVSDVPALSAKAYPNPFSDKTIIDYNLPGDNVNVSHTLLNSQGQVLQQKDLGQQNSGRYQTPMDGSNLPDGVYMYQLRVGNESQTIRLIKKQ